MKVYIQISAKQEYLVKEHLPESVFLAKQTVASLPPNSYHPSTFCMKYTALQTWIQKCELITLRHAPLDAIIF